MFYQKTVGKIAAIVALGAILMPPAAFAQQPAVQQPSPVLANDPIAKIKDEGMNRSQVMATMRHLTDVIGARLTNSPSQRRASNWTKDKLAEWGMQNAKLESWGNFGRGWELKRFSAAVTAPDYMVIRAFPKAWSPSTNGAITGDVIFVDATDEAGLEKYKGKLRGAIVLANDARPVKPGFEAAAERRDEKDLLALADANGVSGGPQFRFSPEQLAAIRFSGRKQRFFLDEGVAVVLEASQGVDSGTIRVMGASVPPPAPAAAPSPANQPPTNPFAGGGARAWDKDAPKILPQLVVETEQYNRLVRLVRGGAAMKMTVDLDVKFHDDDLNGYNTIAEIPGTDLKDEVVMIGAHLDSWHSGTGATDNGAGVTVVMEAMRILQAAGLKPRRTIRVGLWTGEEQGIYGSRGYVTNNFASVAQNSPNELTRQTINGGQQINIIKKPAYDKFAAYYNLDNGTGKIRGVYMQGNESLRPVFRDWLQPFREMGASTLTVNSTGGTDHLSFDAVGLPGFQFIQDPIEYTTRTWHTTQDVSDRIIEDDLKQSAIIMAAFAYNSAMTDQKLPRKSNPLLNIASLFNGANEQAILDEYAFANSNLHFSVCGHALPYHEIPTNFPTHLTLGGHFDHIGE